MLANFGKRRQGRVGHIFSKVKKFINFRVTRNNTVYPQMRTRERNYFIPPLTLVNVVWKFFSFKCDGGFPPQIRGLIFDSKTRPRLCNEAISFAPSLSPTNDILSIISIFSNYDLQLGRKNVFNMGRISLFFFFFFFYQFFLSR